MGLERMTAAEYRAMRAPKVSKYRAVKTTVDGHIFDSRAEARRYGELVIMERAGEICNLVLQPRYELQAKQAATATRKAERAVVYVADFAYTDLATGRTVVEDVKGVKTQAYQVKRKLFIARYQNVEFREIKR